MEYQITKTISIDAILSSSETIILNKGGKHQIILESIKDFDSFDRIIFSIQLKADERHKHSFIIKSAAQHLNNLSKEDIAARERDKIA